MDRITRSFINELLDVQELQSEGEAKDFEKLVNYSIISNNYNKTFDLDYVTVGSGNDTGIDGIAVIVNGQLIETTDEIDDLIETNGQLEVQFIFIQAKTSSNFNSGEINTFLFGVRDFFSESPQLVRNDDILRFSELSAYLYEHAPSFRSNPNLSLYYATTGSWVDDQNLVALLSSGKQDLERENLFDDIKIEAIGAKELGNYYRKTKERNTVTIVFENRITIPSIDGVSESYIGLVPFGEFKKTIIDDSDKLLDVFEDNVRDFQGDTNDVNKVISKTINGDHPDLFSVLNNGVTIVASTIGSTGDNYTIVDYQIVNGCQTSTVLYLNRYSENIDNIRVPVKIIATTDEEIKNKITLATNSQTPIKKEQLAALTFFQRRLEQFYNAFEGEGRLYYERRSKQYNADSSVMKTKIITIPIQIKSFSAMFLENPHMVTSYFGTIVNKLNSESSQIFKEDHVFIPYYVSALAYYRLESLFRRRILDSKYKKVRFHLMMLFKRMVTKESMPFFNSRQMEKYCEPLLQVLGDENQYTYVFQQTTQVVDSSDFDLDDKQHVKQASKTQSLISELSNQ